MDGPGARRFPVSATVGKKAIYLSHRNFPPRCTPLVPDRGVAPPRHKACYASSARLVLGPDWRISLTANPYEAAIHGPFTHWLPRVLDVKFDTASDPWAYPYRSPKCDTDCCLPAGQNRRHSPTKIFGAQHLQGRLHPLPLHLACFRAYASTRLLPVAPQGSILGSRLTITQAGLAPARTRGLARPHWPLFHQLYDHAAVLSGVEG